jgi:hypothetical protein
MASSSSVDANAEAKRNHAREGRRGKRDLHEKGTVFSKGTGTDGGRYRIRINNET